MRGMSQQMVCKHVLAGVLDATKLGSGYVFTPEAVKAYRPIKRGRGRPLGSKDRKPRGSDGHVSGGR